MKRSRQLRNKKTFTKIKEVKSFLVFANFYRHVIKNLSHIAKPLNELRGEKKQKQKNKHQNTFKELKDKILEEYQMWFTLPYLRSNNSLLKV